MEAKPTTEYGKQLKSTLSPALWAARATKAHERVAVVEAVLADANAGEGTVSRESVRRHAPGVHWSTFRHWLRCYQTREGPAWERLLDRRVMPAPWSCPGEWRISLKAAYCQDPAASFDALRKTLRMLHGEGASLGDNTIRRILQESGLWKPHTRTGPVEKVTELHGGGGLVLLLAAELETFRSLGEADFPDPDQFRRYRHFVSPSIRLRARSHRPFVPRIRLSWSLPQPSCARQKA